MTLTSTLWRVWLQSILGENLEISVINSFRYTDSRWTSSIWFHVWRTILAFYYDVIRYSITFEQFTITIKRNNIRSDAGVFWIACEKNCIGLLELWMEGLVLQMWIVPHREVAIFWFARIAILFQISSTTLCFYPKSYLDIASRFQAGSFDLSDDR
jgi:hypothetical protein